jgi:FkbM family methyltransferase
MVTIDRVGFGDRCLKEVKLYGSIGNGDVVSIFIDDIYRKLPVEGKTVVDVGANIGDSAVYFASRGASSIIGIEPFRKNYAIALKNADINGLSKKIRILLAGCGSNGGNLMLGNEDQGNLGSSLIDYLPADCGSNGGNVMLGNESQSSLLGGRISVPILTLDSILTQSGIGENEQVVLKLDCEGCEYDIILSAEKTTLRKFSHIQIEYHYGYKILEQKLLKCGFRVSHTIPQYSPGSQNPFKKGSRTEFIGYIYAERN